MKARAWWLAGGCLLAFVGVLVTCRKAWSQEEQEGERNGFSTFEDYVAGQEGGFTSEPSPYINLDVKDKDLHEVLKFISRRVGVNIIADSDVKETVNVTFDRVEWRNALKIIAEQTHCKIIEVSERLIRLTQPPSISMEFQDADIKVVLELLAKQAGANIVMSSDITGKVGLSLRDVPWRDALDTLVKTAGYVTVRAETGGESEILRVVRPESLRQQLETRHFQLRYVRPEEPYRAKMDDVEKWAVSAVETAGGAETEGGGESAPDREEFSLRDALKRVISEEEKERLEYDPTTNTFIVKATKPKLDEIENIIRLVDVRPPQVYVEVKFIRTTNADILERGLKFDLPSTPERDGFQVVARGAAVGEFDDATTSIATDPLNIFGGTYPFNIGDADEPPFGLGEFQALGLLDFTQTQILLRLIKDDERSRIVQEPSLTMVNNKPAVIFVGETIPFAVQNIQSDQNGNITVAIDENKRSPINVGFTLYLVPHVVPGTDSINLSVIPKVSALSGTTSTIEGFERFEFQQQGGQTQAFIDLPRESSQTVITYLRVQDGHTAVIGGLQTERRTEIETRIPLLSSIPILGNLFTWKRKQTNVESLLILITPHILKNAQDEDYTYRRAIRRHQKADYFYQTYEKDEKDENETDEDVGAGEGLPVGEPESEK